MRKIAIALSILAVTVISCQKTEPPKESSTTQKEQKAPKYVSYSGTDSILHNAALAYIHEHYGFMDTTYYELARQTAEAFNYLLGTNDNVNGIAGIMTTAANDYGYLQTDGRIKPMSQFMPVAISKISNTDFRNFYKYVYENPGSGSTYQNQLLSMISTVVQQNPNEDPAPINGFGEVYIQSDVYVMGQLMPAGVQAADAMGFASGWDYGAGGGRPGDDVHIDHFDPLGARWYWANRWSVLFSQAVACKDPNAH